ncbi:hypothetical protein [Fibrobacter sp. UWP2]|uniref:hypothetical protein n=1 Tax=Fibrobacter sp. UWP2 TaxID=1896216 RepID=UPI000913AC06|nr:hypothetical protein [Fibrobacter sp. UWP2]SHJ27140.1 hypothetical protein SAMN05720471_12439 [Fibrobacter sp. UWP2]
MRKKVFSLYLVVFFCTTLSFIACSNGDSSSREVITEVNSIFELGICGEDNEGDTVYAKEQDADYYCHEAKWSPVATPASSSSAKSSSSVASSSSMTKDELKTFTELCKASGGTAKDGACVCKSELCDIGAVCNTITGVCGNQSKPSDISSDSKSSSSSATATSSSSENKPTTFADLCKASGGTAKDGACVCDEVSCDEGVLCNTKSKECANKDAVEIECDASYKNSCSNSPASIGIVKECIKGIVVNRSCGTVSCNEEGSDCGECLDDVQTCTEDKNFKATVTRCEKGKKVTESCNGKSCDPRDNACGECTNYEHTCTNDETGKGTVYECVAGEAKKAVSICGNKSCRTDKAICGECLNGELRCDNDINNNAIMYRCVDGQWERLHNKYDPLDKDNYKCPVACREGYPIDKMIDQCDMDQCSNCDPCWGEPMIGSPSNPNPCYDEERCKQILKDEDPDYPPFRDFETKQKWKDLIPSKKMVAKTVHGYNWMNHKTVSDPDERVEDFEFDLTNETRRVSCDALGTYFGVCHNSLQTCINTSYHKGGFMVVCANGELVDTDGNNDGIACNCEDLGNVNAYGCCYTRSACFKQTNWARDRCAKPQSTAADE